MLLERALHSQGFGSRKACRALIESGRLSIAGAVHSNPDEEVPVRDLVLTVDGVAWPYREHLYLALHKPAAFECSHQPTHHPSVFTLLPPHMVARGIQCVGRLDADTTGLLLLSDDGAFVHALSSPKRHVPKVYEVHTADEVTDQQLERLNAGVVLRDDPVAARAETQRLGPRAVLLTLDEGRYHQVKRMLAAVGNHVERLHRQRIGAFALPAELPPGRWVEVEPTVVGAQAR